ncbi:MAG TPA: amidohydrolase family protein [Stellaceae bacterium]|nr:amidohydrolase family protein [Stellaceae bacterium]
MPRFDTHHHMASPRSLATLEEVGIVTRHEAAAMTAARALEDMDRGGITVAVNSTPAPPRATLENAALGIAYARDNNDYLAQLVADHRGRFGMFAALPMPHVDATLKELAYALDVLKADGVYLMTSYIDHWLGDQAFAPVFDELNRRKALIYTHPHSPYCCTRPLKEIVMPDAMIEFGTDTTRAIANMVLTGTAQRCPDLKIIWSHAGGTMPFLIYRFLKTAAIPANIKHFPQGIVAELKKFYYDTAQASHAVLLTALRQVVGLEHTVFGSDYPWSDSAACWRELQDSGALSAAEMAGIEHRNILPLLPRFERSL